MEDVEFMNSSFWQDKSVFVTGHTGFKGAWLSLWLERLGSHVTGFSQPPPTTPSLYEAAHVAESVNSVEGDILDLDVMRSTLASASPEIVFHLAAQSLVRPSYENPVETFSVNVMGTVNLLEAIRSCESVKSVVVITSDKCYENRQWVWGYREDEAMGGFDPYSGSKGCAELVIASYRRSFFEGAARHHHRASIASARSGNVLGGGDWATDRLVPDIVKSLLESRPILIRNPKALRPWLHVLDSLNGYLILAEGLYNGEVDKAEPWNFGPYEEDLLPVGELCATFLRKWGKGTRWQADQSDQPHEAHLLKLDSSKARSRMDWKPRLRLDTALDWVVEWYKSEASIGNAREISLRQLERYESLQSRSD